jgi:histidinol-phosphatase (PHP family)
MVTREARLFAAFFCCRAYFLFFYGGITTYHDSHVHTRYSHDGSVPADDLCRAAVAKGLSGIAFTDHCDVDNGREFCLSALRGLKKDALRLKEVYAGQLEIAFGIEIGEGHHNPPFARELAADPDLDFIIGSLHAHRGLPDYYYVNYDRADIDGLMRGYYEELEEMIEFGCFDVVGHINYQLRYMSGAVRKRVDVSAYYGQLRKILRMTAAAGKGIEVNTSGLWRGAGFTLPSADVVKMFREEGGRFVTTGSDSHDLGHVGGELETAVRIIKDAGFERYAFYQKRTPRLHDI